MYVVGTMITGGLCRGGLESGGNYPMASPSGLMFAAVMRRGQGFRRAVDREFPSHRPCASGSGQRPSEPKTALARSRGTAALRGKPGTIRVDNVLCAE